MKFFFAFFVSPFLSGVFMHIFFTRSGRLAFGLCPHLLRPFLYRSYIVLISFLYFYIGTI